jgi:hypothetical protein
VTTREIHLVWQHGRDALLAFHRAQFFDFLRRLPKEQIGADGGAEYGDNHGDSVVVQSQARPQRALRHR